MPTLAEKTPLYDLNVHMIGQEHPIKVVSAKVHEVVSQVEGQFAWSWPGKYGSGATVKIDHRRFVLSSVSYTEIVRSRRLVPFPPNSSLYARSFPRYVDAFLEDEENDENDE